MKKEEKTSKIKKKKEEKYKLVDAERLKKVELIISLIVGVIFLVLLVLSIINVVFLPATLILFALLSLTQNTFLFWSTICLGSLKLLLVLYEYKIELL